LGRQSIDPVFASLARRRPDLSSAHFAVSYLATGDVEPSSAEPQARGRLGFSVPKRLLARAVDRNALKRVAREAWRHARWNGVACPGAAMIKLRRIDEAWRGAPRSALKKAWRGELDELIRRLAARVRANQRGGVSSPSACAADHPLPADPSRTQP